MMSKTSPTSMPRDQLLAKSAFANTHLTIPLGEITPLKSISENMKKSSKYQQVLASVMAVGLVEQLVVVEGKVGAKSIQNIDTMIANVKYELVKSKPTVLKAANKSACNEKIASYKYFLEVRDTLNFVNVTDTYVAMEYLCRVCKTCPVNAPTYVSNITDFSQISFTCSN